MNRINNDVKIKVEISRIVEDSFSGIASHNAENSLFLSS